MAKPNFIALPGCEPIPIIFEDRSVLAIDKPRGWMLVPDSWRKTNWNLQTAIDSSIRADDFWARSRNLRYLRHVHRLDADTSGVMLFAKSEGAMRAMGEMFESRRMEKTYLAVVEGVPKPTRNGLANCPSARIRKILARCAWIYAKKARKPRRIFVYC